MAALVTAESCFVRTAPGGLMDGLGLIAAGECLSTRIGEQLAGHFC